MSAHRDKVADLAWRNECEGWLALGSHAAKKAPFRLELFHGIVCVWWQGTPGDMENYLLLPPAYNGDLEAALLDLQPAIRRTRSATILRCLTAEESHDWRRTLSRCQFFLADTALLMACPLEGFAGCPGANRQIIVSPVETPAQYEAACQLVQRVFNNPVELTQFFANPELTRLYAAWQDGQVIASATLWPFGGTAGVYSVATDPLFRYQGVASAVVERLLIDAFKLGFAWATLRTTDNLFPVYQACGFQPAGRVSRWIHLRQGQ